MLTKRTQILFDQELWKKVAKESKEKNLSIGQIVREALKKRYEEEEMFKRRSAAIERTLKIRPKPFKGRIDYKELINAGRKY